MGFARLTLTIAIVAALSAYAFDCLAMATPEQAMECCKSMHCSSHGHHGQDCCKAMPTTRTPFVQPSSAHGTTFSPVALIVMHACGESLRYDSSPRNIAEYCHAPPIIYLPAPVPIRI